VFFVPKRSVLQKKRSSLDLCVFLSQKWLRIQVSGGAKFAQGGQNISRGSSCPPTSRAYDFGTIILLFISDKFPPLSPLLQFGSLLLKEKNMTADRLIEEGKYF